MSDILITNGLVITQDEQRRIIDQGAVAITGSRIEAVGKKEEVEKNYSASRVIDATERLIIPGLIDAHVHLASPLCRGLLDDIDSVTWINRLFQGYYGLLDEELYRLNAYLACMEMLKTGTTTFAECGTLPGLERAAFEAVAQSGIRGVLARTMMDIYEPPGLAGFPVKETTEEGLAEAEEFLKRYQGAAEGRVRAWLDLHQVPNSSDELCLGCFRLAKRHGVGIMTHAAVTAPLVRMTWERFGCSDIERLERLGLLGPWFLAVHMGWINGQELLLLKQREVSVAHCPSSSMHGAYGSVSWGKFPEMVSVGVNVALGCDGANCSNYLDMVREMNLAALAHKETRLEPTLMNVQQVLDMATVNGARALGLKGEIGSLAKGKKADLVIFDLARPEWAPFDKVNILSNLVYAATGASVDTVIVDGQVVVENKVILTLEEREILIEAQKAFAQLKKKICWLN